MVGFKLEFAEVLPGAAELFSAEFFEKFPFPFDRPFVPLVLPRLLFPLALLSPFVLPALLSPFVLPALLSPFVLPALFNSDLKSPLRLFPLEGIFSAS